MAPSPADPGLRIRPARADELDRVGDLTLRAYRRGGHLTPDDPYVTVLTDARARAAAGPVLVAVRGARLLGTVTLCPPRSEFAELARADELEVRFLAVEPSAWGRGVGSALVHAADAAARAMGLRRLVLFVLSSNAAAHRMYLGLGFRRVPARDWRPDATTSLQAYEREVGAGPAGSAGAAG